MLNDLRYAVRALLRTPGFAWLGASTLALGIGANTAIFSVVHAVLIKPLPYRDPLRLARLNEGRPGFELNVSYPNFLDWRQRSRMFADMALYNPYGRAIVSSAGRAEAVAAGTAESRLFTLLGVQPIRGRVFTADEERPGAPDVVLISHGLWQRKFGSSDAAIGQPVPIGSKPTVVVGVLPSWFRLQGIDVWWPLAAGIGPMQEDRSNHPGFQAIARLRDDVDFESAQREMSSIAADLERQYPVSNHQMGVFVRPLIDSVVGRIRPMLWLLGGAVGFLLLIACANVANVLLARGLRRERETAVRAALGAGRFQLVRLFWCESVCVALLGGAGGILLAAWGVRAVKSLPAGLLPRVSDVSIDVPVLAYALALSLATSVVFGLAPALQLSRVRLMDRLRQAGPPGIGAGGRRLRLALIAIEVALSLTLLVGAGLMLRTLHRLSAVDPGYRPEGLLAIRTQQPSTPFADDDARRRFAEMAVAEIASGPGVAGAAVAWPLDQVSFSWSPYANFSDKPFPRGQEPAVQMAAVSPEYFRTMAIPLRRGRVFDDRDVRGATIVGVVNETLVRRFLPAGDPIGRHVTLVGIPELPVLEIVGVVGDTLRGGLTGRRTAEVYCAYAQFPAASPTIVVRAAAGDPLQLQRAVEDRLAGVNPEVATYGARRLADAVADTVGDRRILSKLLTVFAGLALGLTAIGIAGVVSFIVAQRTQEIGVRIALGARSGGVIRAVVADAVAPVLLGLMMGAVATFPLTVVLQRFLFEVKTLDPVALAGAAGVLLLAAIAAAYLPARRATRVDPISALRVQ